MPLAVLRMFRERLGRQLANAEAYRAMLEEQWLPGVGAAICAAHYMEHQLRCGGPGIRWAFCRLGDRWARQKGSRIGDGGHS